MRHISYRSAALATVAAAMMAASPAAATVYIATRTIGTSTATVSLTTDGTIGALQTGNILSFSVAVAGEGRTDEMTNRNGSIYVNDVIATATDLSFDFDKPGVNRGLLIYPDNQGGTPGAAYWGVEGLGGGLMNNYGQEYIDFGSGQRALMSYSGVQVFASTEGLGGSAVPEPATWAMMGFGFGFIGWSLRRVKRIATVQFV